MISSNNLMLYLIRHGETAWSVSGQHTGRTDIPLTGNGEEQARKLSKLLPGIKFKQVLTSPLQRAKQTCALAGLAKASEIEADLIEWNYGDYEGRNSADILQERPDWLIERLRMLDGNIALFTHGQFGGVLAVRWIGLPLAEAQHFPLNTASPCILGYDQHHPETAVIRAWNAIL